MAYVLMSWRTFWCYGVVLLCCSIFLYYGILLDSMAYFAMSWHTLRHNEVLCDVMAYVLVLWRTFIYVVAYFYTMAYFWIV